MKKGIQPPACSVHGLHRTLSSYWLGWRTEKIRQGASLFWFGLRNDEFFTCEPQSKEQLMSLPHLWSTV
jgi:hypothetical protein